MDYENEPKVKYLTGLFNNVPAKQLKSDLGLSKQLKWKYDQDFKMFKHIYDTINVVVPNDSSINVVVPNDSSIDTNQTKSKSYMPVMIGITSILGICMLLMLGFWLYYRYTDVEDDIDIREPEDLANICKNFNDVINKDLISRNEELENENKRLNGKTS